MTRPGDEHVLMDADVLAAGLRDLVAAIDRVRAMGLPVTVPESLFAACQDLVDRRLRPAPHTGRELPAQHVTADVRPAARVKDVPLRRLLWQVMDPGEVVTVTEITARLAAVGAVWPPYKVSNALSYWVNRGRLVRERKGLYRYPTSNIDRDRPATDAGPPGSAEPEIGSGSQPTTMRRAS